MIASFLLNARYLEVVMIINRCELTEQINRCNAISIIRNKKRKQNRIWKRRTWASNNFHHII